MKNWTIQSIQNTKEIAIIPFSSDAKKTDTIECVTAKFMRVKTSKMREKKSAAIQRTIVFKGNPSSHRHCECIDGEKKMNEMKMESNSTSRNSNINNDLKLSSHHQHVEFG